MYQPTSHPPPPGRARFVAGARSRHRPADSQPGDRQDAARPSASVPRKATISHRHTRPGLPIGEQTQPIRIGYAASLLSPPVVKGDGDADAAINDHGGTNELLSALRAPFARDDGSRRCGGSFMETPRRCNLLATRHRGGGHAVGGRMSHRVTIVRWASPARRHLAEGRRSSDRRN